MMNRALVFGMFLFVACQNSSCPPDSDVMRDFNAAARSQILSKFDTIDLFPMSDREKCILKETISGFLDELNDFKITQIDSFYVRNYTLEDLGRNFSVVMIKDRYYLLALPRLFDYWYTDKYYNPTADGYKLRGPDGAISRINSAGFDEFISNEVFVDSSSYTLGHFMVMLNAIFPELTHKEIRPREILEWIAEQPPQNQDVIESSLGPIIGSRGKWRLPRDWRVYRIDYFGFVLFAFKERNDVLKPITVDIYFLPFVERLGTFYESDDVKYKNCYPFASGHQAQ